MDYPPTSFSTQGFAGVPSLRETLTANVDYTVINVRQCIDEVERYSTSIIHTLRHKIILMYESSVEWLHSLDSYDRFSALIDSINAKSNELIAFLRSHDFHVGIQSCFDSLKGLMYKEVSKQAIMFGCGGLLTGALIGICVGYTVRSGTGYSQLSNGGPNNYLMRAILSTSSKRGIDGITLSAVPTPKVVNPDDVVIQVRAVGIDMIDTEIAFGYAHKLRAQLGLSRITEPFTLGRECSGIVVDVGGQVQSVEINDRVWAYLPLWSSQGLMSEYAIVPEKYVALKPSNITHEGAATMPYAFVTFWEQVIEKTGLSPQEAKNKRILIHLGISSKNDGVGLLATQLFKSWGARVTISTEENRSVEDDNSADVAQMTFLHSLKTLGAESHLIIPADLNQLSNLAQRLFDLVINTDTSRFSYSLSKFCKNQNDKVIETFPPEIVRTPKGIGSIVSSFLLYPFSMVFSAQITRENQSPPCAILTECRRLVESRLLVPIVAKSFLPSQYDQAFRHVAKVPESSGAQAKVGKNVIVFNSALK